jgi:hypothetical protein
VVRQRSAKPLFIGSIPIAASTTSINSIVTGVHRILLFSLESLLGHEQRKIRRDSETQISSNVRNPHEIAIDRLDQEAARIFLAEQETFIHQI